MLYTYTNRRAGTPNKTRKKDTMSLDLLVMGVERYILTSSSYGVEIDV